MNFKKISAFICCLSLCISFTACGKATEPSNNGSPQESKSEGRDIVDNNSVKIDEPDSTEHSFAMTSRSDGVYVYKCADCGKEETLTISCVEGTQNSYTVENGTVTFCNVDEKSVYSISGTLYGNIVIDAGDESKFELQACGLTLYSYSECPIMILSGDKITLSAKKSTENYVYDMRGAVEDTSTDAVRASIYSMSDLNLQGKGSLSVKSLNNNGIHSKGDLNVKNLTLQVDCKDNALKGNDSVSVESGSMVLISRQGDGIKTSNNGISAKGNQRGTVEITGGDILIYAACDGIDSAYDVSISQDSSDVNLQIFTDKYSKYSESITSVSENVYYVRFNSATYSYSLKFYNTEADAVWYSSSSSKTVGNSRYFPITKPSGYSYVQLYIYSSSQKQGQDEDYVARTDGMTVNENYDTIALQARGNTLSYAWTNYSSQDQGPFGPGGGFGGNDGNSDKGDHSTKGIKAENSITVTAGTITVSSYDDALHANASDSESGEATAGSISVSGGNLILCSNDDAIHSDGNVTVDGGSISVLNSYEGIEGSTVNINGGEISVISSDDGINGTATSGTAIMVSGGTLYIYAGGDGVDSNSTSYYSGIVFSGGACVIISTGQADSSIDTERGYKYTGGYVVAIGRSGGMSNESTSCSDFSSVGTSKTLSLKQDSYLVISGIAVVKMPVSMNALAVCLGKANAGISASSSANYAFDANGVYWMI